MAVSQNGFPVLDSGIGGRLPTLRKFVIPGADRHFVMRDGSTGFLLALAALTWHEKVERIDGGIWDEWAYAVRNVRGSSSFISNHASGTAIDVNATQHPLGVSVSRTFTAAKVAKIRAILGRLDGCLTWGGVWGRPDGMHIEVTDGKTLAQVEQVARRKMKGKRGKRILAANPGLERAILT